MNERPYFKYWGKARQGEQPGQPYHLLPYHCMDVAAVGKILLESHRSIRTGLIRLTGLPDNDFIHWCVFFLAIHDLGKFATSFQQLQPDLLMRLQQRQSHKQYTERHDFLGYALWQRILKPRLQEKGLLPKGRPRVGLLAADYWASAVTGHHGQPPKSLAPGFLITDHFEPSDQNTALAFVDDLTQIILGETTTSLVVAKEIAKRSSWWLAGFSVLCDWLGSNSDYFPFHSKPLELSEYWEIALDQARSAVDATELLPAQPADHLSLKQLISETNTVKPTPLQKLAKEITLGEGPQLFILEDVTGAGKTEAAILLAHRLMQTNRADGIYFGLPTMATANAMYERMGGVYRQLYSKEVKPSLVLSHSARNLSEQFRQSLLPDNHQTESEYDKNEATPASTHCSQWLGDSRKKALLAEMGIGTIDQALLAILPSRHQSLRLLGLMHKVLLVDEVHACDAYMQPLLCNLLRAHAMAGGSAILLSATLPQNQRQQLLDAFTEGMNQPSHSLESNDYPLLTHCTGNSPVEVPIETRPSVRRYVRVEFVDSQQMVERYLADAVNSDQCACWIRNTVADAREAYIQLKTMHPDWRIDLFHARFVLADRLVIEQRVLHRFGKSSNQDQRKGQILIATQVVEQSLDLDFDRLITDLAPIDLIIQRAGRLHRHRRDMFGNRIEDTDQRAEPTLTINAPAWSDEPGAGWYKDAFRRAQTVYEDHGQLWLTMKLLRDKGGFRMPEDARDLIEGVYGEDNEIPEGLWQASAEAKGENRAKASIAVLNQLKLETGYTTLDAANWWDEAKTPTRLGEETTILWLAWWVDGELRPLHDLQHFAWQQSSVAIRSALIAEAVPNEVIPDAIIQTCTEQLPAKGKWGVLLPLLRHDSGILQGRIKDQNGIPDTLHYHPELGLMTSKEYNQLEG